jgi:uncharacterized peroxidase-related enzyme
MNHPSFVDHTPQTAPAASAPYLARAAGHFGFVPGPLARMAASPALVEAFVTGQPLFEGKTRLSRLEREVVVMEVSVHNGCEYCVAMHTGLLRGMAAPPELIEGLRQRRPLGDGRLEALRSFVARVLATRGAVGDLALGAFLAAGYDQQQALDVVLGIGLFTLSTYANRLTGVPLDAAFEPFRWREVRASAPAGEAPASGAAAR